MLTIDREKYLRLVKSEGYQAALTALHNETNLWEIETFEGEKGYQPAMWEELKTVRDFSRELWDYAIKEGSASS